MKRRDGNAFDRSDRSTLVQSVAESESDLTTFRWIVSGDKREPGADGPGVVVRVAAPGGNEPVTVGLGFETDGKEREVQRRPGA